MTEALHYTDCGLDNVWLANGFTVRETRRGLAYAITEAGDLHAAIALSLITAPYRYRGQEVRFLRSFLDLPQSGLARIVGTTRGTIARWEGEPDGKIPGASDRALRLFMALKMAGSDDADRLVELLQELDEIEHGRVVFEETPQGWERRPNGLIAA